MANGGKKAAKNKNKKNKKKTKRKEVRKRIYRKTKSKVESGKCAASVMHLNCSWHDRKAKQVNQGSILIGACSWWLITSLEQM